MTPREPPETWCERGSCSCKSGLPRERRNALLSSMPQTTPCALQVSLPSFRVGLPAYYVIATSEASANLARFDGVRYGPRHEARASPRGLPGMQCM